MRHSTSRRRSGFTFIEMLVVFVVFSAVAMISIRAVGDTLRRDRVHKVGAIVAADVEQAFSIAARLREPVRMVVDRTNKKFSIMNRNTVTPTIYKTRSFASASTWEVDSIATGADTSAVIMPNGIATNTLSVSFIVKSTNGQLVSRTVSVSKGGLVRVNNR